MSIVLKDGIVLPDFPEDFITDEHPYVALFCSSDETVGEAYWFYAYAVTEPILVDAGDEYSAALSNSTSVKYVEWSVDDQEWQNSEEYDGIFALGLWAFQFVWSNHDVYVATGFDENNNPIRTEIYFKSSVFRLPDGTELPAFPDGCFDGTPYGVIIGVDYFGNGELMYSLQVADKPFLSLPATMVPEDLEFPEFAGSFTHAIVIQPGTHQSFPFSSGKWYVEEPVNGIELEGFIPIKWVLWANHDLCEITKLNEDMTYTVGSTIVRKSDENYRVTGGYMTSIANEARRLGGKTGGMLPAVTEATLRGVKAGGGSVSDAHWLETAWGQDEFSYEIPFPISLTADMTTWLKNSSARSAYKSIVYDAATDTNTCSVYGVGGSEAIAFHKELKAGVKYTVSFDYFTSTGTSGAYPDVYAPFIAFIPDDLLEQGEFFGKDLFGRDAYVYTALSNSVTQNYVTYTCEYTPGKNMDVYIALISGCVADGRTWNFKMKNIKVTEG
jgi:hypothetical protein